MLSHAGIVCACDSIARILKEVFLGHNLCVLSGTGRQWWQRLPLPLTIFAVIPLALITPMQPPGTAIVATICCEHLTLMVLSA